MLVGAAQRLSSFTRQTAQSGCPHMSAGAAWKRHCRSSTRLQSPESLRVAAENTILTLRSLLEEIVFHDFDRSCIRCRDQAHWPIGTNHQAVRPKTLEATSRKGTICSASQCRQ